MAEAASKESEVNPTLKNLSITENSMEHGDKKVNSMDADETNSAKQKSLKEKILQKVCQTDAHFKHQQRGDPDLTEEEKFKIAEEILDKNLVTFLSRFGKYLSMEDMEYFIDKGIDYEVEFYSQQIRDQCNKQLTASRVKNRRYAAMKQLISRGEYFSEEEMKYRDPYLYHNLIGQYLTDEEVQEKIDKSDLRFSTILLKHMDQLNENEAFAKDKEKEVVILNVTSIQII